jgi:hypothetical protein
VGRSPATMRRGALLALAGEHMEPVQDDDGDDEPRRELDLAPDADLRVAGGDHRRLPGRAAAMKFRRMVVCRIGRLWVDASTTRPGALTIATCPNGRSVS